MPFGLRNALTTFQRLIDNFRARLGDMLIAAYLDDISPTIKELLEDLGKVLDWLGKFKLHVNRDKCRFCCEEVKYLAHVLNTQGIGVDPEKIEATKN